MPWRCPACQTQIRHSDAEDRPRPHALYRCHICRLELQLDERTNKLALRPVSTAADNPKDRNR
jgi:hypothetical protein